MNIYMELGDFALAKTSRQWIVGEPYETEQNDESVVNMSSRTYHVDLRSALRRLVDEAVLEEGAENLQELTEAYERVTDLVKERWEGS